MKALSLSQPWATMVAIQAKRIETRSWSTPYRGPLAIHAAKNFPPEARRLVALSEPFRSAFLAAGYSVGPLKNPYWIPLGKIVAVARLVDVVPILRRQVDDDLAIITDEGLIPIGPTERAFGDYTPGRCAWLLAEVFALPAPIPARGQLGLWEWPYSMCPRCEGQRFDVGACSTCGNVGYLLEDGGHKK